MSSYEWPPSLGGGGSGANTTLSNLTSPTAINESLLFNPDNTFDIGAIDASRPKDIFVGTFIGVGNSVDLIGTEEGFVFASHDPHIAAFMGSDSAIGTFTGQIGFFDTSINVGMLWSMNAGDPSLWLFGNHPLIRFNNPSTSNSITNITWQDDNDGSTIGVPPGSVATGLGRPTNIYASYDILAAHHIGGDLDNYINFSVSNQIEFVANSGSMLILESLAGASLIAIQGNPADLIWTVDGGGDIGSPDGGVTPNRPNNLYLKGSIFLGGLVVSGISQTVVATNGGSITINDMTARLIMVVTAAGTIASYTVTMPANPVDNQVVSLYIEGTVTVLTISPNAGQAIINGSISNFNQGAQWIWQASGALWYRAF